MKKNRRDEGVIKFKCDWKKTDPLPETELRNLINCRQKLFQRGWIGVYSDGIGYGNLSHKKSDRQFIISGSQTGQIPEIRADHFALVTGYSVAQNRITCQGPIPASSESLTHAMIYEIFPDAAAVIHVHSPELWKKLKDKIPTTRADIPYGTPQMAVEIKRLAKQTDLKQKGILVMAGHEDGVITFGKNFDQAYKILTKYAEKDSTCNEKKPQS